MVALAIASTGLTGHGGIKAVANTDMPIGTPVDHAVMAFGCAVPARCSVGPSRPPSRTSHLRRRSQPLDRHCDWRVTGTGAPAYARIGSHAASRRGWRSN
jgi:hypothetical protein